MRYADLFARLLANSVESTQYFFEGCPCWEWTGRRMFRGYAHMCMRVRGKPTARRAHRVMAEVVLGRELHPDLETIEHRCGIPWCVNYQHFSIVTRSENSAAMQARRHGKPRRQFKPLIDRAIYAIPPFERALPVLKSTLLESSDCPF